MKGGIAGLAGGSMRFDDLTLIFVVFCWASDGVTEPGTLF